MALRIVEERAVLTDGLPLSATAYERTSRQSRDHVKTLREALLKTEEDVKTEEEREASGG